MGAEDKEMKTVDRQALLNAERFFLENKQALIDYARRAGLSFEPGGKWSVNMRTGRGTFDVAFFVRKGYMAAESMWAVCHEIEHFRDWKRDPEGYAVLYNRLARGKRRLEILYHELNDIAMNREEDRRFPAHVETRERLYTYKFIPRVDHSQRPLHLQFIEGIVREKMLPVEGVVLAPEVRAQVEKLKNIDAEGTDLIDLVCDTSAKPGDRFEVVRDYIEPIYERYFHRDVEERRKSKKKERTDQPQGDKTEVSLDGAKGGGEEVDREDEATDEDYFEEEYDELSDVMPQTLSTDEIRSALDQEVGRQLDEAKTAEQIAREQFESLYGVSVDEVEDYARQYGKIEAQIRPLRTVFEQVIAMRKEVRRRLKERTDEGVILDPSLVAQAYIDAGSGIADSRTQLRIRRDELDEHRPLDFEFTLICDLSGSMNEELPGGKSYEQRLCTILIAEALDEFEKKLSTERAEGFVDLRVFTEVRGFGAEDEELKPMTGAIDYHTRVRIAKRLASCVGRRTAEFKSLTKVAARIEAEAGSRLEERDLKRAVVLITDGGSDDVQKTRGMKETLKERRVVTKAIQVGDPSTEDREKFKLAWEDDGLPCRDVTRLVPTMERLMEELIESL
jgi:hypothetical protein